MVTLWKKRWGISGHSLVETMITVGIVSALALVVAPLMVQTSRFYFMSRTKVEIQREARNALETITRSLRQARSDTIVIDRLDANQPHLSRLRFTTVDNRDITFHVAGSQLIQTHQGLAKVLSSNIRFVGFYFSRSSDMSIISVSLTFEKVAFEGRKKALHVASERVRVMN